MSLCCWLEKLVVDSPLVLSLLPQYNPTLLLEDRVTAGIDPGYAEGGYPIPQDKNTTMLQQIRQLGYPSGAASCFDSFNPSFLRSFPVKTQKRYNPRGWAAAACDDYFWAFFKGQSLFPSSSSLLQLHKLPASPETAWWAVIRQVFPPVHAVQKQYKFCCSRYHSYLKRKVRWRERKGN